MHRAIVTVCLSKRSVVAKTFGILINQTTVTGSTVSDDYV